MPCGKSSSKSKRSRDLPKKANEIWKKVYQSAIDAGDSEDKAARKAWGAVEKSYKKVGDKWVKRSKKTVESGQIIEYLRSLKNVLNEQKRSVKN